MHTAYEQGCSCHLGNPPCSCCMETCSECRGYFPSEYEEICPQCGWYPNLESEMYMSNQTNKYRNLAAILNPDVTTVAVSFVLDAAHDTKTYTYKCDKTLAKQLKPKDKVVCEARGFLQVVEVVEVHHDTEISPEDTANYKWIYCQVDVDTTEYLMKLEEENAKLLASTHRTQLRKKFLQEQGYDQIKLLTTLPEEKVEDVE